MERKLVTIVFADLVGSTALADAQDPERTRALLDRFYDRMAAEIEAAGGTVEKFAGDAVMAAFGAPVAHEDDAERALHAALAMRRVVREIDDRLSLRIGVNTGNVVVDRPREGSSFVTGDAVNVAARLEQAAAPDDILVGERTVAAVRGAFDFDEPNTVDAKGKVEPVACRRLIRALSLMRPRGVAGLHRAFVARERELAQLEEAYRTVVGNGCPALVTILGDAGVGKSRLVREFWESLAYESPQPIRLTGRCLSYGEGTTYWPVAEVLKEQLGILESDPPELVLERLGDRRILGLALGLDVAGDLHPLAARDRFEDACVEFFEQLAVGRPAVVLVEDVHWAEEQLLALLAHLAERVRSPLLLLVTARPELLDGSPGWAARASTTTIRLDPLSPEDAVRMVGELVEAQLPDRLRDVVIDRSEGNPFFVEELLSTLIDRDLLVRSNGGWSLRELPPDFSVPDSVQAVLASRIDLLAPAEKEALQAAAVIGRIFWAGPVYELVGGEPDLRVLEERDFIRRRSSSSIPEDREYAIKHALTREVAYGTLPKARRVRLHAAFADWIGRTGRGRDEHAALLAHHYAEAVRPEDIDLVWAADEGELQRLRREAVSWLRRAATLAIGRYELDDGIALLDRALELEEDAAGRSEIWREIGRANALKFDGDAFLAAMQASLESCTDQQIRAETYAELAFQTSIRSGMWRRRPDPALVDGWIDQALELADRDSAARAMALIARCFWGRLGTADEAVEASAIADRIGDVELRSNAWGALSVAAFASADYEAALDWAGRRLEVIDEITDPDHVADVYELAVPACCATGRFIEARRLAVEHDHWVEPLSVHHRLHGMAVLLELDEVAGDWDNALELTPHAEKAVEANLATPCIRNARSLLVAALAAMYRGEHDEAQRLEERANEVAMEGYGFVLAAPRARLALLRGELDEVERLLPLLTEFQRGQTWFALPSAAARFDALAAVGDREAVETETAELTRPKTYLEPFALRALGLVREDPTLIDRAVAGFETMRLDWYAAETKQLKAKL
jgi:class 3 adenylate cyclase/tetratricopeptide (TPR) repeat protein